MPRGHSHFLVYDHMTPTPATPTTPTPVAAKRPALPNSKRRTGTPGACTLPRDWHPKPSTVRRWSNRLGIPESQVIEQYLDKFKRAAAKRDFMYRNWDAAFGSSIRNDWFGLRPHGGAYA